MNNIKKLIIKETEEMIKKFIVVIFAALFSLQSVAQTGGNFTITGKCDGVNKGVAKLYLTPPSNKLLDSVAIVNSTFSFKGSIEFPQQAYVYIVDNKGDVISMFSLFLEKGDLSIVYDPKIKEKVKYLNSPLSNEVKEYSIFIDSLPESKEMNRLRQEIHTYFLNGNAQKVNELNDKKDDLLKLVIQKIIGYKTNSLNSQAAAYHICTMSCALPLSDQDKIAKLFDKDLKSCYLDEYISNIERERRINIGQSAPDFKLSDLAGVEYSLENFKGKYVFLEFSASWCGWCMKEVPFIRDAYNALKGKNIVFITINMDKEKGLWSREVTKENIEWMCLSNLKGMDSDLARSYNIHGIPASFVIDPDGKIINRDLRGEEVKTYLSGLAK